MLIRLFRFLVHLALVCAVVLVIAASTLAAVHAHNNWPEFFHRLFGADGRMALWIVGGAAALAVYGRLNSLGGGGPGGDDSGPAITSGGQYRNPTTGFDSDGRMF